MENKEKVLRDWFYQITYGLNPSEVGPVVGSDEELKAYLKAVLACAGADGAISDEERSFVVGSAIARGCSDEVVDSLINLPNEEMALAFSDYVGGYKNNDDSKALIFYALKACNADGGVHDKELASIITLANQLEVDEHTVHKLFSMAKKQSAQTQRIRKLIGY